MQHVEGAGCREWKLWLGSVQTSKREKDRDFSKRRKQTPALRDNVRNIFIRTQRLPCRK